MVEETVVIDILALVGVEIQFSQAVEIDLLKKLPLSLDIDTGISVTSRLVIILPAKAATATTRIGSTTSIVALSSSGTGAASLKLGSSAPGTGLASTLATATSEDGPAAVS